MTLALMDFLTAKSIFWKAILDDSELPFLGRLNFFQYFSLIFFLFGFLTSKEKAELFLTKNFFR